MLASTPSRIARRFALPAIALTALAGGLTACGNDGPDTPATTAPVETQPTETQPTETQPTETQPTETTEPAGTAPSDTDGSDGTDADLPTEESAEVLVDLDEDEAADTADELGWTLRVVRRDGEDLPVTMDLRENRVNVEVADGVVTAVVNIG